MKRQIKLITTVLILFFYSAFACAQSTNTSAAANSKVDSADLQALVVKLLKWHQADKKADFEPLLKNPKDSVYAGVDWTAHKKRVGELEKTGFFTKEFMDNYQKIALQLDKELKQNRTKYMVGDLPPYDHPNEWCNCQDYPSNALKRLKIVALKTDGNAASFKWTWGNHFFYAVKAKKENNVWKIAELEQFNVRNFQW